MTKHEFLKIMEYELGNLNENIKSDILSDFRDHFEIAEKSGKSEEEICQILGNPKEIAREFIADIDSYVNLRNDNDEPESREKAPQQQNPDSNRAPKNINNIYIEAIACDIRIAGGNYSEVAVEFEGDHQDRFVTEIIGDTYSVKELPHRKYANNFLQRLIQVNWHDNVKMNVFVPEHFSGNIDARTASGDVAAGNLLNLGLLKLKTASGDVELNSISTKNNASTSTGSGDITVNKVASGEKINFSTGSGDVDLENCAAENDISISTGSGDVEIQSCIAKNNILISTGSGDVESNNSVGTLKASTGSGEIEAYGHTGTVYGSTGSGDINIKTNEMSAAIKYSTGSGDVNIECGKISENINISTGAGDIRLRVLELTADIIGKTGFGDIKAEIGRESDVRFVLKTGRMGEKRNNFPVKDSQHEAKYKVSFETNVGDITVKAC